MKHKILITAILGFAVIFFGCRQSGDDTSGRESGIPVAVQIVNPGEIEQFVTYSGDIKAELEVKVFSKIPDRIEQYFVDEGDAVSEGAPIARVMSTTIEQAVKQAEAGLSAARALEANSRSEYERAQRLFNQNAMSRQQFDAIKTQYEAAVAQVEQAESAVISARSQYTDATISSPVQGIIAKRYFEAGDLASPGMPVVSVVRMDNVKVEVDATESDLGKLATGQSARIRVRSYDGETFSGKVHRISPILDPLTRMATVEVVIPNSGHRLKPGMFASVEIITGILKEVLVVPRFAVLESTSLRQNNGDDQVVRNYYIYVVNDSSRAEQRKLDVDYVNHRYIAVRSGVRAGERMVISGQANLREGMAVEIVEGGNR